MNDMTHDQTQNHGADENRADENGADENGARENDAHESDTGVIDEPVLDGATEHQDTDVDPRKGLSDPALIRDIDAEKKTVNPYG